MLFLMQIASNEAPVEECSSERDTKSSSRSRTSPRSRSPSTSQFETSSRELPILYFLIFRS